MGRLVSLVVLGLLLTPRLAVSASLSPGLEQRLSAAAPGDSLAVILNFADRADLSGVRAGRAAGSAVIARLRAHADRGQPRVLAFLRARGLGQRARSFWITNSVALRVPASLIPELARLPDLATIEYDEPVRFEGTQTGGGSPDWSIPRIGVDQVWKAYGLDGTGIVVGSLDTGFDPAHPALLGRWRGGSNSWTDIINGIGTPYDDHGHGTHTIGTMVGGDGPGPYAPDIGVAYNARFIAAKVLDASNSFSSSSIVIAGAQWMLDPDGNPLTDDFPHVINNSWLFFGQTMAFYNSVTAWRAAGIIPVFCIGNNGPAASTTLCPGNYDNTIGVGATDISDLIASFSSRGPTPSGTGYPLDQRKPDLSAPGASVLSALPGGGFGYWSGTSMASPHVAGTVALMLQAHPGGAMSFDEVRTALIGTAVDLGAPGYDHDFGYGRLDALDAVNAAIAPGLDLTGAPTGHDVHLEWNASTYPDLIRYDVYRSTTIQDPAPEVIGSATDTAFVDSGRLGINYYRIKAIRTSGLSPFSNEVAVEVCGLAPSYTTIGTAMSSPVAADFNGDGHLDVAMTYLATTGTVRVALGDGAGQFGPVGSFPAGGRPDGLASGDFNGDGIRDLVVANNLTTGILSVLIGNGAGGLGDGTFAALVPYPVGTRPTGVIAADFDQDGILDLATTCNGSNAVYVLRGNGSDGAGDGTFAAAVSYATGNLPIALASGDFDHDDVLDLAVLNNGGSSISILIGGLTAGRADGTFAPPVNYVCGSSGHRIVTGDFDDDGILDLAATRNVASGMVAVLLGQGSAGVGDGTFGVSVAYPAGSTPQGIATADLNGDGITDLCVANGSSTTAVSVLLGTGAGGTGDGGFEPPIAFSAGLNPGAVAIADFDHDTAPDLAVTNLSGTQNLAFLPGLCPSDAGTALTLVAPNGGQDWPAGMAQTISWTMDPGIVSVNLEVSRDDGTTWETIATEQTGTSFDWMVTAPLAPGTARVRVHDSRVSSADASDAPFTISPDLRLDAPPGPGEALGLALWIENPALDRMRVRFRLGSSPLARLEVLDVTGRRVLARPVGQLGAGEHVLELGQRLRAGIYLVRLTQDRERITKKAALLP